MVLAIVEKNEENVSNFKFVAPLKSQRSVPLLSDLTKKEKTGKERKKLNHVRKYQLGRGYSEAATTRHLKAP